MAALWTPSKPCVTASTRPVLLTTPEKNTVADRQHAAMARLHQMRQGTQVGRQDIGPGRKIAVAGAGQADGQVARRKTRARLGMVGNQRHAPGGVLAGLDGIDHVGGRQDRDAGPFADELRRRRRTAGQQLHTDAVPAGRGYQLIHAASQPRPQRQQTYRLIWLFLHQFEQIAALVLGVKALDFVFIFRRAEHAGDAVDACLRPQTVERAVLDVDGEAGGKPNPHGDPEAALIWAARWSRSSSVMPGQRHQADDFQPIGEHAWPVEQQDVRQLHEPLGPGADDGHAAADHPGRRPRLAESRPITAGRGLSSSMASKAWAQDYSRRPLTRATQSDNKLAELT